MLGMKAILAGLLICLVVDLVRGGQISYDGESEPKIVRKTRQNAVQVKFFEEVKTTVVHNIDKNHLVTNVYLEDFHDLANLTSYPQMAEMTLNLALVPEGNFTEFYSNCIENLKSMGPNLTKIHFSEAKNMIVVEENVYENLKKEHEKMIEDARELKSLLEEKGITVKSMKLITEVVINDLAMKLDELNEVFDANVTSEFALVYGFISNASLGEINLQHTYVFSTKTLFNSPETMAKYKGSILTEKIPSSEASMRRRIESRLPQRCLRPLIANSIVCLASPDRMMVTKQDGKDEQSNFCCEFF
ncbi:unnamed protein product [Bursaphelenchus xylophilus]|uniref:(pine wood nematode) hypothetical protein n=1 Tax=Bursaphelenchus xylophilus TaxID=6326 RepID=A0A7I8WYG5_BURXY|nr:unnamed protein product [Bursaphelenchus xylophilus]CAG9100646.1 unnamed protein product [Bursaphelenchus xylophilus]